MGVEERTDLLKYNIARHMKDLLGLDFIEIRLLDRADRPAGPAADRGDDPAGRQPRAVRPQGGQRRDRVRRGDRAELPLPRHDARPALPRRGRRRAELADRPADLPRDGHRHAQRRERRSPTPSTTATASSSRSTRRNVASALNTLELLQAEKVSTATASVEAISRELALPLDDILSDATTVLDRYAGHDEDIIARLRHLLFRAREIRSLIQKVGSTIAPEPRRSAPAAAAPAGRRAAPGGRRRRERSAGRPTTCSACQGATVETARDAHEAIALARQTPYSAALVDIRLPDLDGYETFRRLREVQPGVPIILMTGLRLRPDPLDRQGPPGRAADRPLQAVPGRPPDGSRRAGPAYPRHPPQPRRQAARAPPATNRAGAEPHRESEPPRRADGSGRRFPAFARQPYKRACCRCTTRQRARRAPAAAEIFHQSSLTRADPGAGDGVVADLDLVGSAWLFGRACGDETAGGEVALAGVEEVDRERQQCRPSPSARGKGRSVRPRCRRTSPAGLRSRVSVVGRRPSDLDRLAVVSAAEGDGLAGRR